MRVTDLEAQMTTFKTVFIRDTEKNIQPFQKTRKCRMNSIVFKKETKLDKIVLIIENRKNGDKFGDISGKIW